MFKTTDESLKYTLLYTIDLPYEILVSRLHFTLMLTLTTFTLVHRNILL